MATGTTLRAKLDRKITLGDEGDQQQLTFIADYDDDRNAEWAKNTPALSLSFVVKDGTEAAGFEVGQSYAITIEPNTDAPAQRSGEATTDR